MSFWPIREGPGAEPELDAIVHEVIRKHPRGLHLADVARRVREVYPQNGAFTLLTGIVELDQIVNSLCRLAVRGYIYRIGTERQPVYPGLNFETWPRWKPANLLEVIARAAAGSVPYRTSYQPREPSRWPRVFRRLFRPRPDPDGWSV